MAVRSLHLLKSEPVMTKTGGNWMSLTTGALKDLSGKIWMAIQVSYLGGESAGIVNASTSKI